MQETFLSGQGVTLTHFKKNPQQVHDVSVEGFYYKSSMRRQYGRSRLHRKFKIFV